ncbi:MAG: (d)CMP kinase [Chloroflexi bacterium]|nr:(d)CMP kinase [Chloroflexota bacterium]
MNIPSTIAIDGPAASGKSTLAIALAEFLGYLYFDTGVMYRAVTLEAIKSGKTTPGEELCVALAERLVIDVQPPSKEDGRFCDVLVNGADVTLEIRTPQVDANVSVVSAYAGVRKALTKQQRRIGLKGKVVMVGRDIGTVVLPEAELKIYLDATVEERARRRFVERQAEGDSLNSKKVLQAMSKRDQIDSTRQIAPLQPAQDALIVNSDDMTAEQVFTFVKNQIEKNAAHPAN